MLAYGFTKPKDNISYWVWLYNAGICVPFVCDSLKKAREKKKFYLKYCKPKQIVILKAHLQYRVIK